MNNNSQNISGMNEKRKIAHAIWFPLVFIITMWVFYTGFDVLGIRMSTIGIKPLSVKGLHGIVLSPFAHGDLSHIFSNTASFTILAFFLFYFYRLIAFRVFFLNWIISGVLLWIGGRESTHIGASGIVYGLAFFLFFSGVIRRSKSLGAISLIVVFLYGSMIWGMLPQETGISWEGHLFGAVSGFLLAWYYRKRPLNFVPTPDGSSVSVTWGTHQDYVYEYIEEDEDNDSEEERY